MSDETNEESADVSGATARPRVNAGGVRVDADFTTGGVVAAPPAPRHDGDEGLSPMSLRHRGSITLGRRRIGDAGLWTVQDSFRDRIAARQRVLQNFAAGLIHLSLGRNA
jgi:hypothetical protein